MENNTDKIKLSTPEKVSKEQVLRLLASEGMMVTVDKIEEVTDKNIINAQHNVIKSLVSNRNHLTTEVYKADELVKQFYMAAQKANILVSRDSQNRIVLKSAGISVITPPKSA